MTSMLLEQPDLQQREVSACHKAEFAYADRFGGDPFKLTPRTPRYEHEQGVLLPNNEGEFTDVLSRHHNVDLPSHEADSFVTFIISELRSEVRLAAVARLYEMGLISQSRASEVAGVSRQQFLEVLHKLQIPAIQTTVEDLVEEVERE